MKNRKFFCLLTGLLSLASLVNANLVVDWNLITVNATKKAGMNSNLGSRIEAIEAVAVYDAVNSIRHYGTPYHFVGQAPSDASVSAAVIIAAHDVLIHYFPTQQMSLDSLMESQLRPIQAGREAGIAIGRAAAADIILLRLNDGADPDISYPGPAKPRAGEYRPTPAGFKPGIDQQWGLVKPFLLTSGSQYRPGPPPALTSDEYKKALSEVQAIGSEKSSIRTDDQTHIAQFYKQDAELTVNEAVRIVVGRHQSSLEESALVFALADIAEADARIAIWDAKYFYLFWRPVTALNADADGVVTNNYTSWKPLISTPPHPSYPCGHCGTVTAGFEVLKSFYGDNDTLLLHTTTAGEPARFIRSLSTGEDENGSSRDYGGIHYPFDLTSSVQLGKKVADFVLSHGPKHK